jgi:PPOX class probable F420-dependent enzyme
MLVLGAATAAAGVWALGWPTAFSEAVAFPPHRHFVHDVGAFQLGIGATLALAAIWADAAAVALAGYAVGGAAHTVTHVVDAQLGGAAWQTLSIGLSTALAAVALVVRWRQLGWVLGGVDATPAPAWAALNRQKTVVVTTYRRDGTPVATPVSVAVAGDRAYVRSFERAGKTRRLRRDPRLSIGPSTARGTPTGPAIEATARRLAPLEGARAGRLLARKHPLLHGVLVPLAHRLGRAKTGRTVHFELTTIGAPGDVRGGY